MSLTLGDDVRCGTLKPQQLGSAIEPVATVHASAVSLGGTDLQTTIDAKASQADVTANTTALASNTSAITSLNSTKVTAPTSVISDVTGYLLSSTNTGGTATEWILNAVFTPYILKLDTSTNQAITDNIETKLTLFNTVSLPAEYTNYSSDWVSNTWQPSVAGIFSLSVHVTAESAQPGRLHILNVFLYNDSGTCVRSQHNNIGNNATDDYDRLSVSLNDTIVVTAADVAASKSYEIRAFIRVGYGTLGYINSGVRTWLSIHRIA